MRQRNVAAVEFVELESVQVQCYLQNVVLVSARRIPEAVSGRGRMHIALPQRPARALSSAT